MSIDKFNTSDESGNQLPLFASEQTIGRPCAIKVSVPEVPPGITAGDVAKQLGIAIRNVFRSKVDIDQFEFLLFDNMYILSVTTPTLSDHSSTSTQSQLDDSLTNARKPPRGSREHAVSVLQNKLEAALPSTASIEPVAVDFDPLGTSPMTTCRLATRENRRVAMAEPLSDPTFFSVINKLRRRPHLYQGLITNHSKNSYQLSIRIALCDRESQLPTKKDLYEAIENGWPVKPSEWYSPLGLTSNFEVMSRHLSGSKVKTWNSTQSKTYIRTSLPDRIEIPKRTRIKELAKGHPEYQDLLTRRMGADPLYQKLGYYPKFVVRERDLLHFLGLPTASNTDLWTMAPGRSPPAVRPIELSEPSSLTPDDRVTTPSPTQSVSQQQSTGGKDGGKAHGEGEDRTQQVLTELGFEVVTINQFEEDSVPDLWALSPAGDIYAVEVEDQNETKPASLLINAIRAEQWGIKMLIVGVSDPEKPDDPPAEKKTRKTASNLQQPWRETDGNRTRLYNQSSQVETAAGASLLLPKGTSEAEWWLTPDGTLSLSMAETYAEGDPTEAVSTFDYELPRYTKDGETYIVEDADGTVRNRYDSKDALTSEWTHLNAPLVPTRLHYLNQTEFRYVTTDGSFEEFRLNAEWDVPANTKRYNQGLAKHDSLYLLLEKDSQLPLTEYRPHALSWFRRLTQYKSPNDSYFERCRPEYDSVEKKANSRAAETGKYTYYEGLTWRYPRGIVSPDLPDFSEGPSYPDELESDTEGDTEQTEESNSES